MVSNLWGKLSTWIAPKDLNIPSCVVSFYPLTVFKMYLHMVTGSRSNTGVRVCKESCHPRLPSDKGLTLLTSSWKLFSVASLHYQLS